MSNKTFDLSNNGQTVLYYHAAAGFSLKETFRNAVRAGNYATWPGLMTQLINKHFPTPMKHKRGT
jgi:hypothetical protein